MPDRPYLFYELTNSICSTCLQKVEAKVLIQDDRVYLQKFCPTHKLQKVLLSTDVPYFRQQRDFIKPGQMPLKFNTPIKYGCPYDCGLCPDHEQHSCLTLLEITDHCNLQCPICYSESGPHRPTHRSLDQINFMLDAIVKNEGEPDVVQISGGEPTLHPQFWEILDLAKSKAGGAIKHLMLNTNGIKIATTPGFAERLATYAPRFEIYLQFDSLEAHPLQVLRGEDLRHIRQKALDKLNALNLSTTLVVTLKKNLNDHEIGNIITFALQQKCVRGITFQPIQHAGRTEEFNPATDRLTLSEVRQQILAQHKLFQPEDIIPVPCHPDCLAMAYAIKLPHIAPGSPGETAPTEQDCAYQIPQSSALSPQSSAVAIPLTGLMDPKLLLSGEGNTIIYEQNQSARKQIFKTFSTNHSPESASLALKHLLCCLPLVQTPGNISYDNVFRIIIMQFLDPHNFDVRSVKKTCVHIVHPDGRIIPFDTFNIFYRDQKESRLKELQQKYAPSESSHPLPILQ